jgi:hypothetical protein
MIRRTLGYVLDRLPYISGLRKVARDVGAFPPGHFYSPIPTQAEVLRHVEAMRAGKFEVRDIRFNHQEQFDALQLFAGFYDDLPFPKQRSETSRYYYDQTVFCYPDAIFLYSFLRQIRPARIIEVGSGFSSAVILDTVDRFFEATPEITFVEPYPVRLNQLLREADRKTVHVLERRV